MDVNFRGYIDELLMKTIEVNYYSCPAHGDVFGYDLAVNGIVMGIPQTSPYSIFSMDDLPASARIVYNPFGVYDSYHYYYPGRYEGLSHTIIHDNAPDPLPSKDAQFDDKIRFISHVSTIKYLTVSQIVSYLSGLWYRGNDKWHPNAHPSIDILDASSDIIVQVNTGFISRNLTLINAFLSSVIFSGIPARNVKMFNNGEIISVSIPQERYYGLENV